MDNFYKHYIRLDANGFVIKAFSEAFESPEDGDILLTDKGIRQCNIDLHDMAYQGAPKWKYINNTLTETTIEEKEAFISNLPTSPPSQEERLAAVENALLESLLA